MIRAFPVAKAFALLALLVAAIAPAFAEEPPLSVAGSVKGWFAFWDDRGSAFFAQGSSADYAGASEAEIRAEAGELSRCALEAALAVNAATGEASFVTRELWAEWRPLEAFALRAGRIRLGFGSGFGWNPSNDLDSTRYATDPSAPRIGADAAQVRFEAGGLAGFPLSLSLVGSLPEWASGVDLAKGRAAAQLYALLGGLEIMLAGSLSDPDGNAQSWLAGGWMTFPLGPLVIGIEGAARERSDLYRPSAGGLFVKDREIRGAATATATLRAGDFVIVAEAYWNGAAYTRDELDDILVSPAAAMFAKTLLVPGSVGAFHGLGSVMWAAGDFSASLGTVLDFETWAFVASAEAAYSLEGRTALAVAASIPGGDSLLEDDELGLPGRGWSVRATVSVNF